MDDDAFCTVRELQQYLELRQGKPMHPRVFYGLLKRAGVRPRPDPNPYTRVNARAPLTRSEAKAALQEFFRAKGAARK